MEKFIFVAIAAAFVAGSPSFAQSDTNSRLRDMQQQIDQLRDAANSAREEQWESYIFNKDPNAMPPRPLSSQELELGLH